MPTHKMAFPQNSNDHVANCHGQPQTNDNGDLKKEIFTLRRQVEERDAQIYAMRQSMTNQRTELDDIKAKYHNLENENFKLKNDKIKLKNLLKQNPNDSEKIRELDTKLQTSENKLKSVRNINWKLKRKLFSEREEYDETIETKRLKLEENSEIIKNLESELESEREKCAVQNSDLMSARDKLDSTTNQVKKYENDIAEQNSVIEKQKKRIEKLKCKVKQIESTRQENENLQKRLEEFEQAIKMDALEITQLKTELKEKKMEADDILDERNQFFDFVLKVCALSQFPENDNFPLETQLSELGAHLKETLKIGKFHKLQNQQAPASSSKPPTSFNPPSQHVLNNLKTENGYNHLSGENASTTKPSFPVISTVTPRTKSNTFSKKIPSPVPIRINVTQHAEDVARRKSRGGQGCDARAKYFCKCGVMETCKARLEVHIKQFNQKLKFKCDYCPKRFLHFGRLKSHITVIHRKPRALDPFTMGCKTCGEMFVRQEQYKNHLQTAHIESTIMSSDEKSQSYGACDKEVNLPDENRSDIFNDNDSDISDADSAATVIIKRNSSLKIKVEDGIK